MSNRETFGGQVNDEGVLVIDQPVRWRGVLARHKGRRVHLTVQREQQRRSLKANAYLWGVVYHEIAEWSGHTADEIHDCMKSLFLPPRELLFPTGEEIPAHGSTRVLNMEEFSEYVSKVKLWAAEQGLQIPEPDDLRVAL